MIACQENPTAFNLTLCRISKTTRALLRLNRSPAGGDLTHNCHMVAVKFDFQKKRWCIGDETWCPIDEKNSAAESLLSKCYSVTVYCPTKCK